MGTSSTGTSNPIRDTGTNDRRVSQRHNVVDSNLVTVDLAFQSGALLLDLSDLGMGVQALSSAPIGTMTTVQFDLPDTGGRVDGVGRITWTDSSGRLGIRFEEIAELSRGHLAQWLARGRRPSVASLPKSAMPSWPPLYERDEIAALRRDLTTEKLEGDAALAFVVERIRNVTRGTGVAIALEDGDGIVCRATSGNAPGIGARLDPTSGLSGECMRTGEIVRCEDTETDPRADRLVCRKLELRSIVIVPVRIQGRPAGVLEAFSSRAHAFQSSDVLLLRRMSDLVAGITIRQPDDAAASITGPQALMAANSVEPLILDLPAEDLPQVLEQDKPLLMSNILELEEIAPEATVEAVPAAVPPVTHVEPLPEPVREPPVVPAAKPPAERADAPAPLVERHPLPVPAITRAEAPAAKQVKLEPQAQQPRTPPVARDVVAAAPPAPVATSKTARAAAASASAAAPTITWRAPADFEQAADTDAADSFATEEGSLLTSLAPLPKPWRLRIAGAGILVAVLAIGGWQVWRAVSPSPGTPMDSDMPQSKPAMNTAQPPAYSAQPAAKTGELPLAILPASAAPPIILAAGARPSTTAARPAAVAKNVPAQDSSAKNPAAQNGSPNRDAPIEIARAAPAAEPPPAIGLGRAGGSSAISSVLAESVAAPRLDRPAVSEMTGGKLIKRFEPVYPSGASGLHGEVVLKAMINKRGEVSRVQVVKGQAMLAQAAVAAVKRWRYQPFRLNGIPIEIENTIVVNFKQPGE